MAINCSALPDTLLEAELFGARRGAFTGLERDRKGLFEEAHGGTLLLDEIGETSPAFQAKLLRAIETREIRPLGATAQQAVGVRIVSATHRDIEAAVAEASFRQDLLFRLNAVTLHLPPLRRRRVDIPFLAQHFAEEFGRPRRDASLLDEGLIDALSRHDFPGNVRELRNAVERAIFIDDWHGVFGLPGGSRRRLPENELLIEFGEDDATLLRFDESSSGIGDIPIAVGYQLHASDRTALATWLTVKAPLGNADDLTGSGAVDIAATLSGQSQLHDRWQLFGQASVAWLGEGDLLPELQESFAWTLMGGLSWNAWRGLDLTAQVEANSRIFDGLHSEFDGDALVITFGGSLRTVGGWRFDVGVSEDLQAGASPDVAFNLAVRRGYQ